ncbi:MAG TPA: glycosyltransferase [Steroidobacteraceae bacterium]|nr:glycosyltransferase [Steroidobacteraceae bacterium]
MAAAANDQPLRMHAPPPLLSVVIPVYNEEACLPQLFDRLFAALDALGRTYEVVFVDDGSADRSAALLREQFERRPAETHVVLLRRNFGQHAALRAGFRHTRGRYVVTLDADLQNPPEEIVTIVASLEAGHDCVGGVRSTREDSWFRRSASRAANWLRERTTRIRMSDHGCMLRGYHRSLVDVLNQLQDVNVFLPALAYTLATRPTEVEVRHEPRAAGTSKYSLMHLARLNFDLMTGFGVAPLQFLSVIGVGLSAVSGLLMLLLVIRRLTVGPEAEGVFTLFAFVFFFLGFVLLGIGLLGEFVARIYQQVRNLPTYLVGAVIEERADEQDKTP